MFAKNGSDVCTWSLAVARAATGRDVVAKIEGSYLRVGFDAAANRWRVIDKSGTTFELGTTPAARLGSATDRSGGTAVWMLTRTIDTFGNHVDYDYLTDAPNEGLPASIRYGGNVQADLDHPFEVKFLWSPSAYPARPVTSYRGGYRAPHSRLLIEVET